ncbi:MAG: radical SAM protein [Planctomycetota bacterium]
MLKKGLTQFRMGVKNRAQARRVLLSEANVRLGRPTLRSLEFAVTWICNMHCEFCYAEDLMYSRKRPPNISVDLFADVLRQAHALGLIHVNITGGEPMVRKDILEVVRAVPKDVVASMVVNSTLLNKEKLEALKAAGLSTVQMSYGQNYDKHFKIELARHAIRIGLGVTLSIVNIKAERKWVLEALEMAPREGFSVLFNYPMRYKNEGLDSEVYWKYRYEPYVREDNLFWSGKDRCPAGTTKIYVTNDGDVMTCDRIHGSFGNITKEPLEPIWRRMYARFKDMKTFCLLETCPEQWKENNRRSRKRYSLAHIGTSEDPFNVFKGTPVENDLVPVSSFAQALAKATTKAPS